MLKNVGSTDRSLRLVVGLLLLVIAAGTYTEFLTVAQSVLLTIVLVGVVVVSGLLLLAETKQY